jgi:hypothetical protein
VIIGNFKLTISTAGSTRVWHARVADVAAGLGCHVVFTAQTAGDHLSRQSHILFYLLLFESRPSTNSFNLRVSDICPSHSDRNTVTVTGTEAASGLSPVRGSGDRGSVRAAGL